MLDDATVSTSVWSTPISAEPTCEDGTHDEGPGLGTHARRSRAAAQAHLGHGRYRARCQASRQGQARRARADRPPARQGVVPRNRHARRRRDRRRRHRRRFRTRQRLARHGRRRGLHHAGGQHRARRQLEALPHRRTGGAQPDSAGDAVGGRRVPAHRWPLRPHSHRPARAGELLGARPHRRRRPRPFGRARRTGRPGLRLQDHEPPGRDLHRGSTGRQGVDGRGDLEGGSRRSRRRAGERGDSQRRRGRRSRDRRHPALPLLLSAERVVVPDGAAGRRGHRATRRRPSCSTSSPATTGGSTTCAGARRDLRCARLVRGAAAASAGPSSAHWPISAAIRSRWSPISPR